MEGSMATVVAAVILAAYLSLASSSPETASAFLWAPQHYGPLDFEIKESIDYRTISPKDLARSVLYEGGWSNIVCSNDDQNQLVDIALIFVGRKLQLSDISKIKNQNSVLVDLIEMAFLKSNISMAFPYITVSDETETLENSLISGFVGECGHELAVNDIFYVGDCSSGGGNPKDLQKHSFHSWQDFIGSRTKTGVSGKTDLMVFCNGHPVGQDLGQSEGELLSQIVTSLDKLGATYSVLYASDPYRGHRRSHHMMSRLLAETTLGNASANSTRCDGVCQIKSSLLEGVFVGIVLLIVLISGLCCMMGIDTPARFEAPQES